MKSAEILKKIKNKKFTIISENELNVLLSTVTVIEEWDTHISDMIRLFQLDGKLIVQEKSNKNELILRLQPNRKAAKGFISDRMEIYDRMWDGCGCKIDYYK